MKGNFFNYLKEYGNKSFEEFPFCEADILVFCQLSYVDFDKFISGSNFLESCVSIRDIAAQSDLSALYPDERYEKENSKLFNIVSSSKRYESLCIAMPMSFTDTDSEFQFFGLTYICDGMLPLIVFRGTDKTLIGWKEDMNLSFLCPTPGQELAAKYVTLASEKLNTTFNVAGHSKGGNFAVYASMCANEEIRNNINLIYSLDGPGFRPEILEKLNYAGIADKMIKFLPKSSLIGMLFEKENSFEVIEAKNIGMSQHLLANWVISKGNFLRTDLSSASAVLDKSINNWVYSTTPDDLEKFWNNLFEIIYASDATNVVDFKKNLSSSVYGMFKALKEVPKETQDETYAIIESYFVINKETLLPKIELPDIKHITSDIKEEFSKIELPKFDSINNHHNKKTPTK